MSVPSWLHCIQNEVGQEANSTFTVEVFTPVQVCCAPMALLQLRRILMLTDCCLFASHLRNWIKSPLILHPSTFSNLWMTMHLLWQQYGQCKVNFFDWSIGLAHCVVIHALGVVQMAKCTKERQQTRQWNRETRYCVAEETTRRHSCAKSESISHCLFLRTHATKRKKLRCKDPNDTLYWHGNNVMDFWKLIYCNL